MGASRRSPGKTGQTATGAAMMWDCSESAGARTGTRRDSPSWNWFYNQRDDVGKTFFTDMVFFTLWLRMAARRCRIGCRRRSRAITLENGGRGRD
jgi:hypothetical protein